MVSVCLVLQNLQIGKSTGNEVSKNKREENEEEEVVVDEEDVEG